MTFLVQQAQGERFYSRLSAHIFKANNDHSMFIDEIETSLARLMLAEWTDLAESAVTAGMRAGQDAEAITKAITGIMGGYGSETLKSAMADVMETFYVTSTTAFLEKYFTAKAALIEGTIDLSLRDEQAIAVSQSIAAQTAGRYFPEQVQGKVAQAVENAVLKEGLSNDEAALRLEAELRGALGLGVVETVPAQFALNPSAYFKLLTNNAAVAASNVGRLITMADAGVEQYTIEAVIDKRTSEICIGLNGKLISVAKTMPVVERYLEISSLTDLEELMPFSKDGSTPSWAEGGEGFPPFHQKCRTTVVPSF